MKKITIQCPAKINLDLKVLNKTENGFHNIKSIMQTINLFDFITLELTIGNDIILSGNSFEIPYNEKNICYKAAKLFFKEIKQNYHLEIYIKKNIPVCAGLAGGSTDGVGVLFGLNKLFDNVLTEEKINQLAASLGSDLNFCLKGGTKLCTSRGEKLEELEFKEFDLSLIKPKNLQISAKEAYFAFDNLKVKSTFKNDLEFALINKYEQLKFLNSKNCQMSGSGPTYFYLKNKIDFKINKNEYLTIENLKSISYGVREI